MKTPVLVRAIARGGKFIGDLVGGFSVTLDIPGKPLQSAQSRGSSGNTADLMQQQRLRTDPLPTNSDTVELPGEWAAAAALDVEIDEPVQAAITVCGPGNFASQQAIVGTTVWLLPGIGFVGDQKFTNGLVIELPGLLVQNAVATTQTGQLAIAAQVTMMCGCKIIDNDGIWISSDFTVTAEVLDGNGKTLDAVPMTYVPYTGPASEPSLFGANVPAISGAVSVRIIASQRSLANTGVGAVTIS